MTPLLLIDDDIELCGLLAKSLAAEAMSLESRHNGRDGLEQALSGDYALVLLDVNLPGLTGYDVLRSIREQDGPPVLMLTGRADELDRVLGLEMGADDYLPKPFSVRELAARIRAVLRRGIEPRRMERRPIEASGVRIDPGAMRVWRDGTEVQTTAAEFSLLQMLLQRPGEVVGREEIADQVLGRPHIPYDRNVDMHVCNLRRKLGKAPDGSDLIRTVRGSGYLFCRLLTQ